MYQQTGLPYLLSKASQNARNDYIKNKPAEGISGLSHLFGGRLAEQIAANPNVPLPPTYPNLFGGRIGKQIANFLTTKNPWEEDMENTPTDTTGQGWTPPQGQSNNYSRMNTINYDNSFPNQNMFSWEDTNMNSIMDTGTEDTGYDDWLEQNSKGWSF